MAEETASLTHRALATLSFVVEKTKPQEQQKQQFAAIIANVHQSALEKKKLLSVVAPKRHVNYHRLHAEIGGYSAIDDYTLDEEEEEEEDEELVQASSQSMTVAASGPSIRSTHQGFRQIQTKLDTTAHGVTQYASHKDGSELVVSNPVLAALKAKKRLMLDDGDEEQAQGPPIGVGSFARTAVVRHTASSPQLLVSPQAAGSAADQLLDQLAALSSPAAAIPITPARHHSTAAMPTASPFAGKPASSYLASPPAREGAGGSQDRSQPASPATGGRPGAGSPFRMHLPTAASECGSFTTGSGRTLSGPATHSPTRAAGQHSPLPPMSPRSSITALPLPDSPDRPYQSATGSELLLSPRLQQALARMPTEPGSGPAAPREPGGRGGSAARRLSTLGPPGSAGQLAERSQPSRSKSSGLGLRPPVSRRASVTALPYGDAGAGGPTKAPLSRRVSRMALTGDDDGSSGAASPLRRAPSSRLAGSLQEFLGEGAGGTRLPAVPRARASFEGDTATAGGDEQQQLQQQQQSKGAPSSLMGKLKWWMKNV